MVNTLVWLYNIGPFGRLTYGSCIIGVLFGRIGPNCCTVGVLFTKFVCLIGRVIDYRTVMSYIMAKTPSCYVGCVIYYQTVMSYMMAKTPSCYV